MCCLSRDEVRLFVIKIRASPFMTISRSVFSFSAGPGGPFYLLRGFTRTPLKINKIICRPWLKFYYVMLSVYIES